MTYSLEEIQENFLNYAGSGMSVTEISHRSPWFDDIINDERFGTATRGGSLWFAAVEAFFEEASALAPVGVFLCGVACRRSRCSTR